MDKNSAKSRTWNESELADTFNLTRFFDYVPKLSEWLAVEPIQQIENEAVFDLLYQEMRENVDYWNEQELELFFIGPLIRIFANYKSVHFIMYSEREISATVEGVFLKTEADLLLAKGKGEVLKVPYFCFHEYKRTKKASSDPVAQVLEAMLIAQEMNKNGKPIYGAYVIGKDWYFMVLEGKEYCISKAYQATLRNELLDIIAILRKFRVILETTLI
jgi:hypothetical protein